MVPLLLPAAMLVAYLYGAHLQRHSRRGWSNWKVLAFVSGVVVLGAALLPPLAGHAHHSLHAHMLQHLLIGMVAPLGLVLGAPVSLACRSLPVKQARWLTALLGSRPVRFLCYPVSALLLNTGAMYVLYMTPLYAASLHSPALHYLMLWHFLLAGCLFTWVVAGVDPAPRRPRMRSRLLLLFCSIAAHAYLGKLMYIHLLPANTGHSQAEIESAAMLMYYGGDLAELLLLIALFAGWYLRRPGPSILAARHAVGAIRDGRG